MMRVLFLCIHNSARSQMAEAYLKKFGGNNFVVESAGLEAGKLNPLAVEAMRLDEIDISKNETHLVDQFYIERRQYDFVITVCDEANAARCPIFPGPHKKINWSFTDPSSLSGTYEEKLMQTIEVREKIKNSVLNFIQPLPH